MLTHPTAQALIDGVARWLPVDGSASPFTLRVARNALEIAARDLALGPGADVRAAGRLAALLHREGDRETLDRALVDALRAGRIAPDDPALIAHLRACALDSLAIDQPRYAHEL
ncbi:DUF6285 domain-containing protein [Sphingomonas corticis]|jgi:hypothetical protein|uniref:Protein kinase n=1 Tax=Sphingomonas corticis TaxID=2722791 RepID=A0ABX1CM07_9SPHN|nr:DUF6285 domain-containing protein [Sphingomonas corticis]NJR79020.1 protein kinase [Sphingomonas corticis]